MTCRWSVRIARLLVVTMAIAVAFCNFLYVSHHIPHEILVFSSLDSLTPPIHQLHDDSSSSSKKPTLLPPQAFLNCSDIDNLQIIRKLGQGKHKISFEVELPSTGKRMAAKRCHSAHCVKRSLILHEAEKVYYYQHTKGIEGLVRFYGSCDRAYPSNDHHQSTQTTAVTNFSVGHTALYEMGQVLMENRFERRSLACLASYFTPADVEDLRRMARSYAAANILLENPTTLQTDNDSPAQFIVTSHGIRHADVDFLFDCSSSTRNNNNNNNNTHGHFVNHGGGSWKAACPPQQNSDKVILETNCRILLGGVAQQSHPNCTRAYSRAHPIQFPDRHVRVAKARTRCFTKALSWLERPFGNRL